MRPGDDYVHEYQRLRGRGWTASEAIRAARTRVAFEKAEEEGLVRWRCEPEEESLDIFEPDYSHERPSDAKRYAAEWLRSVERDGIWLYGVEVLQDAFEPDGTPRAFRNTPKWVAAWEVVDGIGGVVGDIRDTGYDIDLMQAALDALEAQRKLQLPGTWGASCLD